MKLPVLGRAMHNPRVVFGAVCVFLVAMFIADLGAYDLWWHIKAGEMIVQDGRVPHADPFSFTAAGRPWIYHSWLSGVSLYLVHAATGIGGLIALRSVLIALSLALAWVVARRRGVGAGLASVLVIVAAYQLWVRSLMRPYLFSFVLFMLFYFIIEHARARHEEDVSAAPRGRLAREGWLLWGGGRLLLLPLLMVLWANLHGGFMVGFLMIGAFGAAEMAGVAASPVRGPYLRALLRDREGVCFRALLITGVLCLAASVITPYGAGPLTYPIRLFAEVQVVREVQEWKAMPLEKDFLVFWFLLAFSTLVLLRSVWLTAGARRLRPQLARLLADVLLVAGFGLMALQSRRNLAWFLLLVPPITGYHFVVTPRLAGIAAGEGEERRKEALYVLVALLCGVILAVRQVNLVARMGLGVSEEKLPVRACEYLKSSPVRGNMYNAYEWGGYAIWQLWPHRKVFVDGRCLVYGDRIMRDSQTVAWGKPGWRDVLASYEVDYLLVPYRKRPCTHFFEGDQWVCIYWDDTALIAVRAETWGEGLPGAEPFPLSNPVVFEERLADTPAEAILVEVDQVLRRQPDCWTAWVMRARCLLKAAQGEPALESAVQAAKRAVLLNDRQAETWRALGDCYQAAGRAEEAAAALRRADSLSE